MNKRAMLAHLRLGIAIAIVAALGGAVGLSLAIATGPGDVPTAPKLPYDNPGPPAPTAPSFSPDNPPPGVPKAGMKASAKRGAGSLRNLAISVFGLMGPVST